MGERVARWRTPWGRVAGLVLMVVGATVLVALPRSSAAREATFDLYVLGGSTALGEPYQDIVGFERILEQLLEGRVGDRPLVVRNLAVRGADSEQVLRRAKRVPPGADLVLVYTGHNEFLEYEPQHGLSNRHRRRFDAPVLSPEERGRVLDEYEANVRALVARMRASGIPVVLATLASNLADWDPTRSVLEDAENEGRMQELLTRAEHDVAAGDLAAAEKRLREALALEPTFAEAHKLLGDLLRRLGRVDAAAACYRAAVRCDQNPLRALPRQNEFLRSLARASDGVHLLDAERLLEAAGDGLPGWDLFWDSCHPTLEGYYRLGEGLARAILRAAGEERPLPALAPEELRSAFPLTPSQEYRVYYSRGQFVYMCAALSGRPRARLERSLHYLNRAAELQPTADAFASIGIAHAIGGEAPEALAAWERALELDARAARERLENPVVWRLLELVGVAPRLEP